jgi:hypothetical protein
MEGSGMERQKEAKEKKRKLPDGEINVAAITPAKMEGSGMERQKKGKEKKRKLPDGEINVTAITSDVRRTRKDGGARVSVCSNRLLASILVSLLVDSNSHSHGLGASEGSDEVFNLFLFQAGFFVCSYSRECSLFVLIPGRVCGDILRTL